MTFALPDTARPLILVVDDETKIRRLLATNLETYGFDVMTATDGALAIEVFSKAHPKPDLVVLDIMLPEMNGFDCAKKIHQIADVPVIFLSARNEPTYKMHGFESGADDYVTKPFSVDELVYRIKAVLRRSVRVKTSSCNFEEIVNGPVRLCPSQRKCWVNGEEIHLADTEFRLLSALMKNPGSLMTHEHLLRTVWGEEAIGELQYLRVAFTRIRRKLEEVGLEGGVISSYSRVGYILRDLNKDPL